MRVQVAGGLNGRVISVATLVLGVSLLFASALSPGLAAQEVIPTAGSLAWYARQAKDAGNPETTIKVIVDERGEGILDDMLRSYAAVVATPVKGSEVVDAGTTYIRTWHSFRVLRFISRGGTNSSTGAPPNLPPEIQPLAPGHIAIAVVGGSTDIDGVRVKMVSNDSGLSFTPGQRYLMFLHLGHKGNAVLALGAFGVFKLTSGDTITRFVPNARAAFTDQILAFKTLDRLSSHIRNLQRARMTLGGSFEFYAAENQASRRQLSRLLWFPLCRSNHGSAY